MKLHNITIINQEASNVNLSNAIGKYDHIVGVDGKQSVVRKFMGGTTTDYLSGYGFVMVFKRENRTDTRTESKPDNKTVL